MDRVLISGASGLIGEALVTSLTTAGVEVVTLVRSPHRNPAQNTGQISWDPLAAFPPGAVSGFNVVIHLAGESVVGRWTSTKKKAIRDSRVLGTRNLASALATAEVKPRIFICASAIGFYGDRGDEILTEESAAGRGFLPEVCREWEDASRNAAGAGIRTVNIRIGLVLSARGGALAKMLPPFKLGLGGRLGSGKQWMSWIHIDDIVGAIHHAITADSLSGPVNLVGPNPVHNVEFTEILASVLRRPAFLPVPEFALRVGFGKQAADEMLLASQRVQPGRLASSGYKFHFQHLRTALENLDIA
ncbi:MAG: TIGR01777 family oxidoreductase [Terriglobales bacterium]